MNEAIAFFAMIAVIFVCMFAFYVMNEKQQTEQMKACVAAGHTWDRHGDTGDCK